MLDHYLRFVWEKHLKKNTGEHCFIKIDLPKSVTVENLKFIHFLDVIENMVSKTTESKDLGARAQGEVSLREAILELRAWCDKTEFVLTDCVGGKGRTVPLIKEWKDIMNQVSDNQSLLISMEEYRWVLDVLI